MTVRLQAGDDSVVVDPRDGRLTSLLAGGSQRLVTEPPAGEASTFLWGCFVMAPWAGRVRDGRFRWGDRTATLDARLHGHAIHGLVMDRPWEVVERAADRATLACHLDDAPWPYTGAVVEHRLRLASGRLDLELVVQAGPEPMPVTVGWHPCFARPTTGDVSVLVPAEQVLATDHDNVPTGAVVPVAGDTDLREGPPLGARRLDTTFVDVDGAVVIAWDDLTLAMDHDGLDTFVVFTPAHEFCVEPQSGWPDAVNRATQDTRTGLTTVDPGTRRHWHTTWRWTPRPRRR